MFKIKKTYPFWIWLCRFTYKKAKSDVNFTGHGVPGVRNIDDKCEAYTPRKRKFGDAPAQCETDGHYLCRECIWNINN